MPMSRRQKVGMATLMICVMLYVSFESIGAYALSVPVSIKIIENDAVEHCDSIRPRIVGGKFRTEPPQMQGFEFFGVIVTDHGGFYLPEPQLIWQVGAEDRASLDRRLLDGHCYEVLAYGFGDMPKLGDALSNRGNWSILSVVADVPCQAQ
jgi:hypothetical protein